MLGPCLPLPGNSLMSSLVGVKFKLQYYFIFFLFTYLRIYEVNEVNKCNLAKTFPFGHNLLTALRHYPRKLTT